MKFKSYPVDMLAVRVAWILNMKEGKDFLWSIYNNENYQYYTIPSVILIIEFLYTKFKNFLLTWLMSAYILQAIFYQAVIYCFEVYFKLIFKNKTPPDENGIIWIRATDESNFLKIIILVLLFLNTLLTSI